MAAPRKRAATKKQAAAKITEVVDRAEQAEVEATVDAEELSEEDLARLAEDGDEEAEGPIGPDGEIRPVQIGKRGRVGREMVHIFTVDDEKFFIPKQPPAAMLIKFQKSLLGKKGKRARNDAVWALLLDLLSDEGLAALAHPDVTDEDFAEIIGIVAHVAFGALKRQAEATHP